MNINFYPCSANAKQNFFKYNSQNFYKSFQNLNHDVFCKNPVVSFCGNKTEKTENFYGEFIDKYNMVYGNRPIEDVISENYDKLQLLNSGRDKKVYSFPNIEGYLIAHLYRLPQEEKFSQMQRCKIDFPEFNFGQMILSNGIMGVMKLVPGVVNSMNDYFSVISYIGDNNQATLEMAEEYLSKLRLFKDFPQSAYDNLAKQIKYLTEQGQFIDFANPNNLLIDTDAKSFHLIDLLSGLGLEIPQRISETLGGTMSGVYEMMSLLLDLKFQCYFLDKMTPEQITETKAISEKVIKKVVAAAKKENLDNDNELIKGRLDFCANKLGRRSFPNRYEECMNLYGHLFDDI